MNYEPQRSSGAATGATTGGPHRSGLNDADYKMLEAGFIDRGTAAAMGLRRVDRHEGCRLMGRSGDDCGGVLIPNILPGESLVREYRLRLDTELGLWDAEGQRNRSAKYLSPVGDRGRLYFPPGIDLLWLGDVSVPILFVEGEKKAAACQRAVGLFGDAQRLIAIGVPGVDGWRGTIQKATASNEHEKKTGPLPDLDLMLWPDRVVFILFDADLRTNNNVLYARRRLKAELISRGSDVICIDMPDVPGCKGIDDLLGKHAAEVGINVAAARLADLLHKAHVEHIESSEILALPDILVPVPPLEAGLIPAALRPWLTDVAERMQCPLEYPVVPALIAICAIVGNEVCVKPKERDSWLECPNLWGAIVGDPGVMKSTAVVDAMRFLKEIERKEDERFRKENPEHAFELAAREAEKKAIKQQLERYYHPAKQKASPGGAIVDHAVAFEELKARFKELEAIEEPKPKRLTTSDATVEKLGELIDENPRGLLNNRDELAGFFANMDKPGREGDRAFYLEAWNGRGDSRVDRISRGSVHIPRVTLSIFGSIQPTIIAPYLGAVGSQKNDDGLIQRFQLMVFPDIGPEFDWVDRSPRGDDIARNVFYALYNMKADDVQAKRLTAEGGGDAFVSFAPDAQLFFQEWFTDLERLLRGGSIANTALRSHISKYRGLMPSLALIFHLIDWASGAVEGEGISLNNAVLAAAWCSFLQKHAERLYSMGNHSGIRAAHEILAHIEAGDLGDEFSSRLLYRKGWKNLSDPSVVKSGLDVLAAHGHIEEVQIPTDGKQKIVFVVNERLR